jgi:hypothetical protein
MPREIRSLSRMNDDGTNIIVSHQRRELAFGDWASAAIFVPRRVWIGDKILHHLLRCYFRAVLGEHRPHCRPGFFLPVRVLSRLFRRLFLKMLAAAHAAGRLAFFGEHAALANAASFAALLTSLRKAEWVVYAKKPFGGPQAVLAYLARYTHRVAIANSRLITADETGVTFKWKDYRIEGPGRYKTMTLPTHDFIRRFLIHVLPKGLHRIRHYGLFANGKNRAANIARTRQLLAMPQRQHDIDPAEADQPRTLPKPCLCCGGRMIIIETFARGCQPKHTPASIRIDSS